MSLESLGLSAGSGRVFRDKNSPLWRPLRRNTLTPLFREARDAGSPIGSGANEAANKMSVNTRLKRSGQRWGRAGGQGLLTFRARLKSGRFDKVWTQLTHRRRYTHAHLSTNDNCTPLARAA